jgi:anti-sigma factor ChrR (cupin superfamily)
MLHIIVKPGIVKPGAVIPAHRHNGMAEALYVVEGDFINEGKQYRPGTEENIWASTRVHNANPWSSSRRKRG